MFRGTLSTVLQDEINRNVDAALAEDLGSGDITARLIDPEKHAEARIITRERGILCGTHWADAVFRQVDPGIETAWKAGDGEGIEPGQTLLTASGPAAALLSAERTALNFLQLLSGTATLCRRYADSVAGSGVRLLDTRKTIPGLRHAQKYAVRCGGCHNHRMGLYDAFLIKENHIAACGGITAAVKPAGQIDGAKPVEVEVENLEQLAEALQSGCARVMLDNFSTADMIRAVSIVAGRVELEVSGNVTESTLAEIAATGVDYISIGALTKDCRALDLSMRLL